jgi:hypothetical protein
LAGETIAGGNFKRHAQATSRNAGIVSIRIRPFISVFSEALSAMRGNQGMARPIRQVNYPLKGAGV